MSSEFPIISIPLTEQAHHFAKTFANEQKNLEKARQVYQNTLAVFAANTFLSKWMQIETTLEESDSWDFLIRYYRNVADLVIRDLGKIECQFLPSEKEHLEISELAEEVFACVAVRLDDSLNKAYLLGFVPSVDLVHLKQPISQDSLRPIIDLADYIVFLEAGKNLLESRDSTAVQFKTFLPTRSLANVSIIASLEYLLRHESQLNSDEYLSEILTNSSPSSPLQSSSNTDGQIVKQFLERLSELQNLQASINIALQSTIEYLGNWLLGKFGVGWEPVFRSLPRERIPIKRRKLIQLGEISVELIVTLTQETEQELDFSFSFEVYPESDCHSLPQGLEVQVLDESETIFLAKSAAEGDFLLKIPSEEEFLSGSRGERFSVRLLLRGNSITEEFILDFFQS